MEGELEANAVELETPAIETEAEEQPVDLEALADEENAPEEAEAPAPTPEDDFEEFEWNGKLIKGPKGLKDGVLRHSDYTKKTQEIAQTRKELEERAERIAQQAQVNEEELQHRATMLSIDSELAKFKDFDWNAYQAYRAEDMFAADEAWNYMQHLRSKKGEVGTKISEAENRRSSEAQQEFAKRMNDTQEYARKKGWTAETDKQILDYALSKGANKDQLAKLMDPLVYEMLYHARLGEQLLNKPAPKPTTPPAVPLSTVASKASPPARKDLGSMSMEEYADFRNKQEAAKRR